MGPAFTRGGGPRLDMGPPPTRGNGPGPASAGKGRPRSSHSRFLKENAPRFEKTSPTTRGEGHETLFFLERQARKGNETVTFLKREARKGHEAMFFFLEREATAPNLVLGTGPSHLLFVEENDPLSPK